MDIQPQRPAPSLPEHEAHEQRLAAALRDLLAQVDVDDYRDGLGHDLTYNTAFLKAEAIIQEFDITHEQLCKSLDDCDPNGDLSDAARRISQLRRANQDAAKARLN